MEQPKIPSKISRMKRRCLKILGAIFSRLLFAIHGALMVVLAVAVTQDDYYWILLCGIFLLFVEMIVTLKVTKNGEWKWFSPMVFLYLCTIVPSVFVMELANQELRMNTTNVTNSECTENFYHEFSKLVQGMEETIILVLIIGRWLMPRGKMNRDQLAQLLLMYLALGADILDILELMKEPSVKTNETITVVGLCLFSWAIMQFTLVLTQSLSFSSPDAAGYGQFRPSSGVKNCIVSLCCSSEIWSVIIAVGMQDGPFLVYRLYLVTREGVFNDSMMFFISKNILSVIIQVYRVIVFVGNQNRKRKKLKQSHVNLQ
ncbi:transmembrane protein 26-like [Anomaloglossus baeobatrachus]|uniref:transmembrane protein 26-like n=1 Tax=Anomaloglossus baeobatrachus TaxID=238106 RepID=UPI003F509293